MACFVVFVGSADPGAGSSPFKCEANINVFSLPNLTPGPLEITLESLIAGKGSMHTLPDFLSWSVLSCLSFSSTLQILAISLLTCVHRWTSHACSSMARPRLKVATRTTGYVARSTPAPTTGPRSSDTGGRDERWQRQIR